MRPPIIALHGKARSGKDTVCQFIISKYSGYRYGFADPLKRMIAAGFGIHGDDPYWVSRKETVIPALGRSPRYLMQTLGTEWGTRLVHPDVWVTLAYDVLRRKGPGMMIPDCRFENEAAWIRKQGGIVVHIVRNDAPPVLSHPSEHGIVRAAADKVLVNNAGLEELRDATYELLDGVM